LDKILFEELVLMKEQLQLVDPFDDIYGLGEEEALEPLETSLRLKVFFETLLLIIVSHLGIFIVFNKGIKVHARVPSNPATV
jgi:hypothetical protein